MRRRRWVASLLLLAVGASSAEALLGEGLPAVSGWPVDASPTDDCVCLCPCACANAQLIVVVPAVEGAVLRSHGVPPNVPVPGLLTRPRARPSLRPPLA